MVMATGKSGHYRYYKCTARMKRGNAACKSGNVPMEKLDNLVLDAFRQKVYTPEHIKEIVNTFRKEASKATGSEQKQQLKKLETSLQETEQALTRIYEAVEKGFMTVDEQLKIRLDQHRNNREQLATEIASMRRQQQSPLQTITPQKIEAVSKILNKRLAEASSYAKAYLKATLSEIRITDEIVSLSGDTKAMMRLIAANGQIDTASAVPRFTPEWWT